MLNIVKYLTLLNFMFLKILDLLEDFFLVGNFKSPFFRRHQSPCTGRYLKSLLFYGRDLRSQIFQLKKIDMSISNPSVVKCGILISNL